MTSIKYLMAKFELVYLITKLNSSCVVLSGEDARYNLKEENNILCFLNR